MLFDSYLVVDWSANSKPKTGRDSIWIGEATHAGSRIQLSPPLNPSTRTEAYALLAQALARHVDAGRRVLIGCDFAYAYPTGFAEALGLRGPTPAWSRIWEELSRLVTDDADNGNNRWSVADAVNRRLGSTPGPFWAVPRSSATKQLCVHKCVFPHIGHASLKLAEYRLVDAMLRNSGRRVQSVWKLFTPGNVGSQTLLGIPRLQSLRHDPELAKVSCVWPFETGFLPQPSPQRGAAIVHAEIWPRIVPDAGSHTVLDARQVITLAHHFAALDVKGELSALFDRPTGLDEAALGVCVQEEGWVLGA